MCVYVCVSVISLQPNMSLYPSMLQLSPSVCLHLLCLLLLLPVSSSTVHSRKKPVPAPPPTELNATQANCSTACDTGVVSENSTVKDSLETSSSLAPLPPLSNLNSSSPSPELNSTVAPLIPPNQSAEGNYSPKPSPSNQQPASPATEIQPAAPLPSATTGSPTHTVHNGSITSTATIPTITAEPVRNPDTSPVLETTTRTTTATITTTTTLSTTTTATTKTIPTSPAATVKAIIIPTRASTTVSGATTIGDKKSPPPPPPPPPSSSSSAAAGAAAATLQPHASSTGMPPVQTSSSPTGPATTSVTSVITPTNQNELDAPGTRVAVVEVAGAALTRQLVDTASLLAVLLFGLLFFLVTVAVFVTQAYESYRRKDYTQVDYLINGMYTDSGV